MNWLPEVLPFLIPIIIFMIPIIAILTAHQRKMAEIYHRSPANDHSAEIAALRQEIRELKALVHQQAIALDSLAKPIAPQESLERRLGGL